MIVRKTTKEEALRVDQLFSIAFELPMEVPPAAEQGNTHAHHWAAFDDDGSMMSTFTISDFQINFDGSSCKMGGVGGVATLPQYRRRGGIRGCFEACLPELYRAGYDFSYLYPFSTVYYRKFGFECCVRKIAVHVDLGLLKPREVSGRLQLCEQDHPCTQAIRAIDRAWEEKFNMMVIHGESDYGWTEKFDPAGTLHFTYVYYSADGTPKAYTTFRMEMEPDGRNLKASRFFFTDREGFDGLMNLFKSLSSDHRMVKFALPASESFLYLLPEWSLGAAQWSSLGGGMVRVINAESVLKKARCHGSGTLTLELQDPQIPENAGIWQVTFENGRVLTAEKGSFQPDIRLTIPAFSALISGVDALDWISGVEILRDTPAIRQVFRKKPLMIVDGF